MKNNYLLFCAVLCLSIVTMKAHATSTPSSITPTVNNTTILEIDDSYGYSWSSGASTTCTLSVSTLATANVLCNGGSDGQAIAIITGGTAPYTYAWSNGQTTNPTAANLPAGTLTVTVTDFNGCIISTPVTISQPAALAITMTAGTTNVTCFGALTGSATANSATGGTAPYAYSWTPSGGTHLSATGLAAGTYTITTTDANGCTAHASVTITQPASGPAITVASSTAVLCFGAHTGTATANTATGGTAPYTYAWTPSGGTALTASNLSAAIYTITAKDAGGCTAHTSVAITEPTAVAITMSTSTNVLCHGGTTGTATAHAATGGTPGYTYTWTSGAGTNLTAASLSAGTYVITARDAHGCSATASVTITQPLSGPAISIASSTAVLCNGGADGHIAANAAIGGTGPYTYAWTPSGGTNLTASGLSAGVYTITARDAGGCTTNASVTVNQPTALAITMLSSTNVLCHGGSTGTATASVATGGTMPYTYAWTPGGGTNHTATNLSAASYTITTRDAHSCTATASVTITQPAAGLSVSMATSTNVLCHGGKTGTATANTATGGTSPYTYAWTPSGGTSVTASSLSTGTYTITAKDAHGCTSTASVTISQPAALPSITISSTTAALCHGGSTGTAIANAASGGTPTFTYAWTPSGGTNLTASGLSAGTYTVTARDSHGCTAVAAAVVSQPAVLSVSMASHTNVLCHGGSTGVATSLPSGGTAPFTYAWAPGGETSQAASGLSARSYTVTTHDAHSCVATASVTITQPAEVLYDSVASLTYTPGKGTLVVGVRGGVLPYTYTWNPNVSHSAIGTNLVTGTYTVTVKDANACTSDVIVSVTPPPVIAGMDGVTSESNDVTLYPNPNNGSFTLNGLKEGQILQLYDYTGKMLRNVNVTQSVMQLNISDQAYGLYLVRVLDKDGNIVSQQKMIKQ